MIYCVHEKHIGAFPGNMPIMALPRGARRKGKGIIIMYMSKNVHILSRTIFAATTVYVLGSVAMAVIRMCIRDNSGLPDMANDTIWGIQLALDALMIIATALIFWFARKKMHYYMDLIDDSDKTELGRLQEDSFGDNLSALPARTILNLLEIWAVITVGMRIVHQVTSIMYRRFAGDLFSLYTSGAIKGKKKLISIYNTTHGFKYLVMMCAILLGVIVTAIYLHDRILKIFSLIVTAVFIYSFAFLDMQKMHMFGHNIGIVWTSVIFHLIETVGLVVFAIYLRKKYRGV
ncbi:MAG TPA: hypothetical protein DCP06_07080 [Lachnospiraceae bacterium]|nr:hypothetical protein [Lachnospiraceae bacterium]